MGQVQRLVQLRPHDGGVLAHVYGADETFNAVRLAVALSRREDTQTRVFLMGDAVTCAVAGQKTPDGYYSLDRMLKGFLRHGGEIACCGTCLDARGLTEDHLIDGAPRSTMDELAAWTVEADTVLTF
ncbi:DsrE/DsrF/TusD sulfur relay family protein [uncultured Ornithinimicrobium sp.]|uniref:DsrE/DsrF/TusD sulfur relay family protein n=1 Tax=uncultured Ornithinimicrobium sp. TaxID=259307 RepID=UPI002594C9A5|nr:DsrE family protein [uncultured Ornithinimicrobium sp.]